MGEYYKGHKLGTCTDLMYITREEVEDFCSRVDPDAPAGLVPYLSLKAGFLYRFPRQHDKLFGRLENIDRRDGFDYLEVYVPKDFELLHDDFAQVHLSSVGGGKVVVNMPFCPLSPKAAEIGFKPLNYWPKLQIIGERYTEDHPDGYTVFACPFCGQKFSCNEEERDVIRAALTERGYAWEAERIKAYKK